VPPVATVGKAAVVALALIVAAIPLLLLDASANDGAAPMTALLGIPMFATAVLIEVARPKEGDQRFVVAVLPWVGGMAVGLLFLAIPATLLEPRYYEAETLGGMLATLAGFTFIIALGVAFGILAWGVVVLPAATLVRHALRRWRGSPPEPATGVVAGRGPNGVRVSAIVLVVVALIVVAIVAFGDVEFERLTVVLIVSALLGFAPDYEIASQFGLWIVRALLVLVVAVTAILTLLGREAEVRAESDTDQSQTR
jgi:hypothetical protein